MIAFINQIPTDAQIRKQLRKMIFGKNLSCPVCRSRKVYASENRYRCQKCRKPFSLFSGTWLSSMKLSLRTFWAILWCFTQKIPVLQAQSLCHLSEEAVRRWYRQFRLHLPESEALLRGTVQMDEAYFKGLSLMMAKQTGTRKVAHQMLFKKSVNKSEAMQFVFQSIQPNSRLQTDGGAIYKKVDRWWPVTHRVDIHRKFEFGLTSEIEGMFGKAELSSAIFEPLSGECIIIQPRSIFRNT